MSVGGWSPNEYRRKYLGYSPSSLRERARQPGLSIAERMVIDELLEMVDLELPREYRRGLRAEVSDRVDGKPAVRVDQQLEVQAPQSITLSFAPMGVAAAATEDVVEGVVVDEIEAGEEA